MDRTERITVMAVGENPVARKQFCALLGSAGLDVVAESGYGINAPHIAAEHAPGVIFVAVDEPTPRAVQAITNLRRTNPKRAIIAHSAISDLALFRQVMRAGANDFLPRPLDAGVIKESVANVLKAQQPKQSTPAASRGRGTIISAFGPKGGIGKTTISANLAVAIGRSTSASVLLVDLDLFFGDVAVLLGSESRATTADLARAMDGLEHTEFFDALAQHPSGISVLGSASHPSRWASATPDQLQALLEYATGFFDYVIVDTPGTFSDTVALAIEMADIALAVTSLDMSSIKDTLFVLEFMAESDYPTEKVHLVVNRTSPNSEISRTVLDDILAMPVFWEIPYDTAVGKASQTGRLVVEHAPESRAAGSLGELAARLVRTLAAPVSPAVILPARHGGAPAPAKSLDGVRVTA